MIIAIILWIIAIIVVTAVTTDILITEARDHRRKRALARQNAELARRLANPTQAEIDAYYNGSL